MYTNIYMENGVLVRVRDNTVECQDKRRFLLFSFNKMAESDDCFTVSIERTYEDPRNPGQFTTDAPIKVTL